MTTADNHDLEDLIEAAKQQVEFIVEGPFTIDEKEEALNTIYEFTREKMHDLSEEEADEKSDLTFKGFDGGDEEGRD